MLAEVFGPDSSANDAVTIDRNKMVQPASTVPPVFKECTTLEECLGQPVQPDYDTFLTPLEYDYTDLTAEQPQEELSFHQNFHPSAIQDSIVTRPIFTPDGTLLFEAEQSGTEAKLDKLIDSLGSLISLLNSTSKGNLLGNL